MNKKYAFLYVVLLFFTITLMRPETPDEKNLRNLIYKNKLELTAENKKEIAQVFNTHIKKCKKKLEQEDSFPKKALAPIVLGCGAIAISGVEIASQGKMTKTKPFSYAVTTIVVLIAAFCCEYERLNKIKQLKNNLDRDHQVLEKLNSLQESVFSQ